MLPAMGTSQSGGNDPAGVMFTDVAHERGLAEVSAGPLTEWASYGPGVAWGDYDNDGDLDIFLTASFDHLGYEVAGNNPEADEENISAAIEAASKGISRLMRNDGGEFVDVSKQAGVGAENSTTLGASWADYDNDGDIDLYLSNYGFADFDPNASGIGEANQMFMNNGDGTFIDVTELAGLGNSGHSSQGIWADYDHDGDLDLYSMNAGMVDEKDFEIRTETNILYRNDGDSDGDGVPEFSDQTIEAGRLSGQDAVSLVDFEPLLGEEVVIHGSAPAGPSAQVIIQGSLGTSGAGSGVSWAGIWFDYNQDGWEDLFVASDFGTSPLYENNGDGTFEIVTGEAGLNIPGTGMGVHAADVDGDGDFELCQTNFGPNYIWIREGEIFDQVLDSDIHQNEEKMPTVNWDCHFFDYDLDGDMDLFFGAGRINTWVSLQENTLFRNDGDGGFTDVTIEAGLGGHKKTMGASVADYDNDGDIDILLGNSDSGFQLMENNAAQVTGNNWLKVDLDGEFSNTHGIGSLVEVYLENGKVLRQQIHAGDGYLGSGDPILTFGLGQSTSVEKVKVHWSTGHIQTIEEVEVGSTLVVPEDPLVPIGNPTVTMAIVAALVLILAGIYLTSNRPSSDL